MTTKPSIQPYHSSRYLFSSHFFIESHQLTALHLHLLGIFGLHIHHTTADYLLKQQPHQLVRWLRFFHFCRLNYHFNGQFLQLVDLIFKPTN